jgi:LPXTG-motif cell wall-anchored protein
VPSGWQIQSIVCDDPTGDSATDPAAGVASIALAAGESVTCTYTNHQPRIPDTGSNSTQPLVAAALALVVLGAGLWILSAGRRRRRI